MLFDIVLICIKRNKRYISTIIHIKREKYFLLVLHIFITLFH